MATTRARLQRMFVRKGYILGWVADNNQFWVWQCRAVLWWGFQIRCRMRCGYGENPTSSALVRELEESLRRMREG